MDFQSACFAFGLEIQTTIGNDSPTASIASADMSIGTVGNAVDVFFARRLKATAAGFDWAPSRNMIFAVFS